MLSKLGQKQLLTLCTVNKTPTKEAEFWQQGWSGVAIFGIPSPPDSCCLAPHFPFPSGNQSLRHHSRCKPVGQGQNHPIIYTKEGHNPSGNLHGRRMKPLYQALQSYVQHNNTQHNNNTQQQPLYHSHELAAPLQLFQAKQVVLATNTGFDISLIFNVSECVCEREDIYIYIFMSLQINREDKSVEWGRRRYYCMQMELESLGRGLHHLNWWWWDNTVEYVAF